MSGEVCVDGWLGCTNNWDKTAHGEFDSEEDARDAIEQLTDGDCREIDTDESDWSRDIAAFFMVGRFEQWDAENSETWCYSSMGDITSDTTDEEIDTLVDELENAANDENFSLDTDAVLKMFTERRDKLQAQ